MIGKKSLWSASIVVTAALLCPTASLAAAKPSVGAGGIFRLKASNGYNILVLAGSKRADGVGEATLIVSRKRSGAAYTAPATVTEASIHADFGALGAISVDLIPSGVKKTVRPICGKPVTLETATYQGTIEFHGEDGYTDASAISVPFPYRLALSLVCGGSGQMEIGGAGLPGAHLSIGRERQSSTMGLEARKNRPDAKSLLSARVSELSGGVEIQRFTSLVAGAGAFAYDPMLRTASVDPPAPFSGEGTYRRDAPPARRWTGDLTVDLPGRADVSLTGPRVPTRLVHSCFEGAGLSKCRNLLRPPVARASVGAAGIDLSNVETVGAGIIRRWLSTRP